MTGGKSVEASKPNPASQWLLEKTWCTLIELAENFKAFKGLDTDFEDNPQDWEQVYNSKQPYDTDEEPWPGKWNDIDYFQKILII